MKKVYINYIAACLPNEPVNNDEMETILGQVGDKPSRARRVILRSNGIKTRYYAIDKESGLPSHTNAELTAEAIKALVAQANFDISKLDCLSCGTTIADQIMPNHAVMVHGEIKNPPCEVVATAGVCLAGVTAMRYGYLGIASGDMNQVIATGSEVASHCMRSHLLEPELANADAELLKRPELAFEKDFLRWMLSDGAGAVLMQSEPKEEGVSLRIEWMHVLSYANETDACMYHGSEKQADGSLKGWKYFEPEEWLEKSIFSTKQDVKQLNEKVIHYTVERAIGDVLEKRDIKPEDVDYFLPHYSSEYFRHEVYDAMKDCGFEIPFDKWFTNLAKKGNTGSASIYIILEELMNSGKLAVGDTLLCWVPESGRFSTSFILLTACDGVG